MLVHELLGVASVALLVSMVDVGQTSHQTKKPTPKAHPAASVFVCPDPEAEQACKSYAELLKAKDSGLATVSGYGDAYVCFRKKQDAFFVISFSVPYFRRRWNEEIKQMVVDEKATYNGHGNAQAYENGVQDPSVMPTLHFSGPWMPWGDSGVFYAEKINFKTTDDKSVEVSIDDTQLFIDYKYQNKFGKTIRYDLTIQRSTGRFSEKFQEESEQVPLAEATGRCVYTKGKT